MSPKAKRRFPPKPSGIAKATTHPPKIMKVTIRALQQIADIAFAVALGMRLRGGDPNPNWTTDDLEEWLAANHEPAVGFLNDFLASSALRDAANSIATAHDRAAANVVGEPTADDVRDITNRLNSVSNAIANDQTFHTALDVLEALARAASGAVGK